MIRSQDTILVYVPFPSANNLVSHKRVLVRLVNNFPQLLEIPDWSLVLVTYMAKFFKPSEVSDTEVCHISSLEVARYYLEKFA